MCSLIEKHQKQITWNLKYKMCSDFCLAEYLFAMKAQKKHS